MRRAVWVLGVLAALCVLTSATLAATVSPSHPHAERQWLRGHGVEVAVPTARWRLEPETSAIRYDGDALVRAPAVLDAGFCPSAPSSSRAFVGLLPPVQGTVGQVVFRAAGIWAKGIAGRALGIAGEPASRVDVDVPVPDGPCAPTTAHLTVVGRTTGAGVVVLVLVRDVGEPGDLSAAEAERIVGSLKASPGSAGPG